MATLHLDIDYDPTNRAQTAVASILELCDLSGLKRREIMDRVWHLRKSAGKPRSSAPPTVNNFSVWSRWVHDLQVQKPSIGLLADVLAVIAGPLRQQNGIELTDRKKHALLTAVLGHSEPEYVTLSEQRLTYRLNGVLNEIGHEIDARATRLKNRARDHKVNLDRGMRQAMADVDAALDRETVAEYAWIAEAQGLHPVRDFAKIKEIHQRRAAEQEVAVEAYAKAEKDS